MHKVGFKNCLFPAAMLAAGAALADTTVTQSMVLDADTDWRDQGTVTIDAGVRVDLNGHKLYVAALAGSGEVVDSRHAEAASISLPKGCYFNSGFKPNQDTRIEFEVTVSAAVEYWCGAWNTAYNRGAYAVCNNDSTCVYAGYGDQGGVTVTPCIPNGRHLIDFDHGVIKVDGTDSYTFNAATFQVNYPLYIGAQNRAGTMYYAQNSALCFHSFKIYDNGTLVRDYAPAQFGGQIGFYDKVSCVLLPAAAGTPTLGAIVSGEDPSSRGELHIDVAGWQTFENSSVTTKGAIKVVQDDPDSTVVDTAVWTGAGGNGNVADPANWTCRNAVGRVIENVLPGSEAEVTVSGSAAPQFPVGHGLEYKTLTLGNCTLTADCDWRGLGAVELNGVVDLAGHTLQLSEFHGTGTITDSSSQPTNASYLDLPQGCYFDTGFKPNQDTRIVFEVTIANAREYWCGAWNTAYNRGAYAVCNDNNCVYGGYGNQGGVTLSSPIANGRRTIDFDQGVIKVDGQVGYSGFSYTPFQVNWPLYIGAQNRAGSMYASGATRFHSFKIYDNGTLVRDYVPYAFPNNKGVVVGGFLDLLTRTMVYPKAGTATYTEVVSEPGTCGTLEIDVPEGQTAVNNSVAVSGAVKVVKKGVGVFAPSKYGQMYFGGTEIVEGSLLAPTGLPEHHLLLGRLRTPVTIDADAAMDFNGSRCECNYFVLNGGTMCSRVKQGIGTVMATDVTLVTDSTIDSVSLLAAWWAPSSLALGGNKLTLVGANNYLVNLTAANGEIVKSDGGTVHIDKTTLNAATVDFDLDCALDLVVTGTVRGLTVRSDSATVSGNGVLQVGGVFKPVSDYLHNFLLLDGSSLDVSERSGTFAATSAQTGKTLAFADDAAIQVVLGDRIVSNGAKVVDWSENPPANLDTLTFTLDSVARAAGNHLVVQSDGLYIYNGLLIIVR